jgi:hypothetical protein
MWVSRLLHRHHGARSKTYLSSAYLPDSNITGSGLTNLRRRADEVGGRFVIESAPLKSYSWSYDAASSDPATDAATPGTTGTASTRGVTGTASTRGATGPKRANRQQRGTGRIIMPLTNGETFAGFRIVRRITQAYEREYGPGGQSGTAEST